MKRKYALAAALVGVLVLPLFGCQKNAGEKLSEEEVQRQAYEYLASRYSAEFTITNAKHEPDVVGPIPSFRSSFHWVLTVVSDRFPDDTFELRYGRFGKGIGKTWHWTDNYYNLLFRDEPAAICTEFAEEFFGVDCIAKAPIFQEGWLDGAGENSTFQEWTQAGGRITDVTIWFCDFLPDDDEFIAFADALTEKLPIVSFVKCRGLTSEGYKEVSEQRDIPGTIWNEHREWIIGRIDFNPQSHEIVLSQRYSTD